MKKQNKFEVSSYLLISTMKMYKIFQLKWSQLLNAPVLLSLLTSEISQLTHLYRYQIVEEVMTDM